MDKKGYLASIGNEALLELYFKIVQKSVVERTSWIDARASIIFTRLGLAEKYEYSIKDIEEEVKSRMIPRKTVRLIVK